MDWPAQNHGVVGGVVAAAEVDAWVKSEEKQWEKKGVSSCCGSLLLRMPQMDYETL